MIRPEAVDAFWRLSAALADIDGRTPCRNRTEQLYSDNRTIRREAASICEWCPVLRLCGDFAEANTESHGVWGGQDRTTTAARRRGTAA